MLVPAQAGQVPVVVLAEQLAQWNSPAYVDKLSSEQGYVAAQRRKIQAPAVEVPATGQIETAGLSTQPGSTR